MACFGGCSSTYQFICQCAKNEEGVSGIAVSVEYGKCLAQKVGPYWGEQNTDCPQRSRFWGLVAQQFLASS